MDEYFWAKFGGKIEGKKRRGKSRISWLCILWSKIQSSFCSWWANEESHWAWTQNNQSQLFSLVRAEKSHPTLPQAVCFRNWFMNIFEAIWDVCCRKKCGVGCWVLNVVTIRGKTRQNMCSSHPPKPPWTSTDQYHWGNKLGHSSKIRFWTVLAFRKICKNNLDFAQSFCKL